jgi:O-Antigen ligase
MPEVDSTVFAAQILFWILLPCVLVAPLRWAILAWLVMGNLDATGPTLAVSSDVGWINATKGILLPLYLWFRLRKAPSEIQSSLPLKLWMALAVYAGVASLWSPFPVAAAKLVGNMVGILLMIIVLEKAARCDLLNSRAINILIIASIGLASLQTFYFGGAVYGFDGVDQPSRFSSFVSAQQYTAFLVAFLAAVLWDRRSGLWTRTILILSIAAAIILNGSRTWFFGAFLVFVVYAWLSLRNVAVYIPIAAATVSLGLLFAVNLNPMKFDPVVDSSSRIAATFSALATGEDTARNVGLANLKFRLAIYQGAFDEIRSAGPRDLIFGHGTSSGGNVILHVFPHSYSVDRLDPNRAIHNEWLRALYEWGILGVALLVGVFASLIAALIVLRRGESSFGSWAVLSFLPAFLLAFTTENVIAGAGNAVTMSLGLILALLWIPKSGGKIRKPMVGDYASSAHH